MWMKSWFLAAAFTLSCSIAAGQTVAPIKLTYASYGPASTAQGRAGTWFMKEVSARTNGRVVFESYVSGSLLGAADLYPGVARGAVDIVEGAPQGYNQKDYPLSSLTLPYITDKFDAVTYAFRDLYASNPLIRQEYESKGIKLLYALSFIENTLWTNKRVDKRSDLKGMRIRALTGIAVAFQELGATVVPMPYPETPEAMKRGTIDGVSASPFDTSIIFGMHKVAGFVSDAGGMGVNAMMFISMNQKKFDSLPADVRKVITEVAAETPKQYVKFVDETVQTSAEKFASESTTQVVLLNQLESKAWREASQPKLREAWLAGVAERDRGKANEMLDQFVGLVQKYEPQSTYVIGIERYRKIKAR